jgi:hypothetical protein
MAAQRGLDLNIIFIFPSEVNPQQLQAFFTRPGVIIRNIVEGSFVRGKVVPLTRGPNVSQLRRSSRIAALPQQAPRANWIVAVTVHYPMPLIDIRKDIEKSFGRDTVKMKNFTDYEAIMPNVRDIQVGEVPVAAMMNDDEMAGLAGLFGARGVGGRGRRITRKNRASRKTRKNKRRLH